MVVVAAQKGEPAQIGNRVEQRGLSAPVLADQERNRPGQFQGEGVAERGERERVGRGVVGGFSPDER
jgi:hypothetical protein